MSIDQNPIEEWKNDIIDYDHKRKTIGWDYCEPNPLVTTKIVKTKEAEYNPILQRYCREEIEKSTLDKERRALSVKLQKHRERQAKYQKEFNIINLEQSFENEMPKLDINIPINKPKVMVSSLLDYDIISNEKIGELLSPSTNKYNHENKQRRKIFQANQREFDVITGNDFNNNQELISTSFKHDTSYKLENSKMLIGDIYKSLILKRVKNTNEQQIKYINHSRMNRNSLNLTELSIDKKQDLQSDIYINSAKKNNLNKTIELLNEIKTPSATQECEIIEPNLNGLKSNFQNFKNVEGADTGFRKIPHSKYINWNKNTNPAREISNTYGISPWEKLMSSLSPINSTHTRRTSIQNGLNQSYTLSNGKPPIEKQIESMYASLDKKPPNSMMNNHERRRVNIGCATPISPGKLIPVISPNNARNNSTKKKHISIDTNFFKYDNIKTGGFNLK